MVIYHIDMVNHIDMVILGVDMGYDLMIWEMTVSIWSSSISIWDMLSLCLGKHQRAQDGRRDQSVGHAVVSSA